MVRLKHKLSEPPPAPERGVKAATFRLLLETAMMLEKFFAEKICEAAANRHARRFGT